MSASLRLLLMHLALDWTAPLCGITPAPDAITAAAITAAAVVPGEVILTADATRVAPGGGPIPMTHHNHAHLDNAAISHDPAEGIDPATRVGLDFWEDTPVINPILQITNVPGVLRSPLTGSNVEQVGTSIPSHKQITYPVAKIVCS